MPATSRLLDLPISRSVLGSTIRSEVSSVEILDLHTHLLPPTHSSLCLWGIDDLLTYHYLVAEYFITAPSTVTPESLYSMTKQQQASVIWKHLFVDRTPISEAARGVCTVLHRLGLTEALNKGDLEAIRAFYRSFRDRGLEGATELTELTFKLAGIRGAVMTNIPFSEAEAAHWRPEVKPYSIRYRSAVRVDPLLAGDVDQVNSSLRAAGLPETLEGAKQYLRGWCETMKPEYLMASTPKEFGRPRPRDEEEMKVPGAFANQPEDCCDGDDNQTATRIAPGSDLLDSVLIPVARELGLPIALKVGCVRGINPSLKSAGDGVVPVDAGILADLCTKFPDVKFLATFLSLTNQHDAAVLANKFRNLHLYGCWWYVNNPVHIKAITRMRVQMLGWGFTFQHSDCRVFEQLVYKWSHSRAVLAEVLEEEVERMMDAGIVLTRGQLRRDIERICGAGYEEWRE